MKQGAILPTPHSVPRVGGTSAVHDAGCNAFMQHFPIEFSLQQTPTPRNPAHLRLPPPGCVIMPTVQPSAGAASLTAVRGKDEK